MVAVLDVRRRKRRTQQDGRHAGAAMRRRIASWLRPRYSSMRARPARATRRFRRRRRSAIDDHGRESSVDGQAQAFASRPGRRRPGVAGARAPPSCQPLAGTIAAACAGSGGKFAARLLLDVGRRVQPTVRRTPSRCFGWRDAGRCNTRTVRRCAWAIMGQRHDRAYGGNRRARPGSGVCSARRVGKRGA